MIEYLRNLLPRVQQYSKSLDHKENYMDKPWVFIDGNNNIHEYEFCRDGRLIMSVNGEVHIGRWEYRPTIGRLLIERPSGSILLQNAFVDDGLMILKKSASDDPAFVLVNRVVIPDLDVIGYLQRLIAARTRLEPVSSPPEKPSPRTPARGLPVWWWVLVCFALFLIIARIYAAYFG